MDGRAEEKGSCTAVVLAGGSGSRMESGVAKQFMLLGGKPLLWYSLQAVQQSDIIDRCILVAGEESREYVRREIVEKYRFTKVDAIVPGGTERCWSVEHAMAVLRKEEKGARSPRGNGYVFIHDSARPFLTEEILRRTYDAVRQYGACVAAMPSKDTVKITDEERRNVWIIQTPQVFEAGLITEAYRRMALAYGEAEADASARGKDGGPPVTDDAGVVERFTDVRVKLVEGSYRNIKITTPEDLKTAEAFLGQ